MWLVIAKEGRPLSRGRHCAQQVPTPPRDRKAVHGLEDPGSPAWLITTISVSILQRNRVNCRGRGEYLYITYDEIFFLSFFKGFIYF